MGILTANRICSIAMANTHRAEAILSRFLQVSQCLPHELFQHSQQPAHPSYIMVVVVVVVIRKISNLLVNRISYQIVCMLVIRCMSSRRSKSLDGTSENR